MNKPAKDVTKTNTKPVIYAVFYPILRQEAYECGYNLLLHGSLNNDMDLVAIPWVEEAIGHEALLERFGTVLGMDYDKLDREATKEQKPHGRIAYNFSMGGQAWMDISVMPLLKKV